MSTFPLIADRISRAVVNYDSWNDGFLVHSLIW